jgi:DNA-binding IclR family transcriptional regulator
VFSAAVPILNRYGDVGASHSVPAPTNRIFPESEDGGAIHALTEAAEVIGLRLGWNP